MRVKNLAIAFLLSCVGMAQMAGEVFDIAPLKGLAAASAASPAPKVFTSINGLETFSTGFTLNWRDEAGQRQHRVITRDVYPGLLGPYNRRNIWGAVLAYGPILATKPLTKDMFDAVVQYGLCGEGPVLRELGVEPNQVSELTIIYTPRTGTKTDLPLQLKPECRL